MSLVLIGAGVVMLGLALMLSAVGIVVGLTWWPSIPIALGLVWLMALWVWRFLAGLAAEASGPAHTIVHTESRTSETSRSRARAASQRRLPTSLEDPDWI